LTPLPSVSSAFAKFKFSEGSYAWYMPTKEAIPQVHYTYH